MKIELVFNEGDRKLLHEVRRGLEMFADSIAKLTADVNTLIGETGPAATAAAVAAAVAVKDAADAAAVDAIDATVAAAIASPAPVIAAAPAAVAHS